MFGTSNNFKANVQQCTREQFNAVLDSAEVAAICQVITDDLQKCKAGELSQEEFDALKSKQKKSLPVFTFHATFSGGRRKNEDAIPSGLSIYDLDHLPNPQQKWSEIEPRKEELGILLAHITPSAEGLRLVFRMPQGKDLAQSQAWMAEQLGDAQYDSCVKDYARCSFAVPRHYVLYLDEEKLFEEIDPGNQEAGITTSNQEASDTTPSPCGRAGEGSSPPP